MRFRTDEHELIINSQRSYAKCLIRDFAYLLEFFPIVFQHFPADAGIQRSVPENGIRFFFRDCPEYACLYVKFRDAECDYEYFPVPVSRNSSDMVILDAIPVPFTVFVDFEAIAVILVQPVPCTGPDHSVFILIQVQHSVVGKSIFCSELPEFPATGVTGSRQEEQYVQQKSFHRCHAVLSRKYRYYQCIPICLAGTFM